MIYLDKPDNFNPILEATGVFLEVYDRILLLLRQDGSNEGNKWGLPSGKVDKGEKVNDAIIREIKEETGIKLNKLIYFKEIYVKYPKYDFVYHIFHHKLKKIRKVTINEREHKGFDWVLPEKALNMDLVCDLDDCIKLFYKIK